MKKKMKKKEKRSSEEEEEEGADSENPEKEEEGIGMVQLWRASSELPTRAVPLLLFFVPFLVLGPLELTAFHHHRICHFPAYPRPPNHPSA